MLRRGTSRKRGVAQSRLEPFDIERFRAELAADRRRLRWMLAAACLIGALLGGTSMVAYLKQTNQWALSNAAGRLPVPASVAQGAA